MDRPFHTTFYSLFFLRVNRSSLHKIHLIVYSYSGLHFCKLFLHLWDGPDEIKYLFPKVRGSLVGEERRVLNELHLPSTLPWLIAHTDWMCRAFIPGNRIPREDRLPTIQREPRVKAEAYERCEPWIQCVLWAQEMLLSWRKARILSKQIQKHLAFLPSTYSSLILTLFPLKETFLFPFYGWGET